MKLPIPPPSKNAIFIALIATPNNVIATPIPVATSAPIPTATESAGIPKIPNNNAKTPVTANNVPAFSNVLIGPPPSNTANVVAANANDKAVIAVANNLAANIPGIMCFCNLPSNVTTRPITTINPASISPNPIIFNAPNSFIAHAPIISDAVQATTNNAKEYAIGIDCLIFVLNNINGPTTANINAAINAVNASALIHRDLSCIKYEPIRRHIVVTSINTVKCLILVNAGLDNNLNNINGNIIAVINTDNKIVNASANIVNTEKPDGAIVQFGGQTAIKLTKALTEMGVKTTREGDDIFVDGRINSFKVVE